MAPSSASGELNHGAAAPRVRVGLIDDHELLRRGLRWALERSGVGEVVLEADNARTALERVAEARPEVLLLDWSLPDWNGLTALRQYRARWPGLKILVLTGGTDEEQVGQAVRAGADGFLFKGSAAEEVMRAVQVVRQGGAYLCPGAAQALMRAFCRQGPGPVDQGDAPALTVREFEVLQGIAVGRGYKEIAADLGISPKSVETYRARLSRKLRCPTRADLVRYALTRSSAPASAASPAPMA